MARVWASTNKLGYHLANVCHLSRVLSLSEWIMGMLYVDGLQSGNVKLVLISVGVHLDFV